MREATMDNDHELSEEQIQDALNAALRDTIKELKNEIRDGLSERAIVHRFAVAIEKRGVFAGWHIDCEYNRHGHKPKRLHVEGSKTPTNEEEGSLVLPDLVIHQRGEKGRNLVVVEAKRKGKAPGEWDEEKLREYVRTLKYEHAYFVSFANRGVCLRVGGNTSTAR